MSLSLGTRRIYPRSLPDDYWASPSTDALPRCAGLLSGSCSSSPSFAYLSLDRPLPSDSASRRTPLLRLAVPAISARRGLSPPRYTTCLAHRIARGPGSQGPALASVSVTTKPRTSRLPPARAAWLKPRGEQRRQGLPRGSEPRSTTRHRTGPTLRNQKASSNQTVRSSPPEHIAQRHLDLRLPGYWSVLEVPASESEQPVFR